MQHFRFRRNISDLILILSLTLLCSIQIISGMAQTNSRDNNGLPEWKVKKVKGKRLVKEPKQSESADLSRVIEDHIAAHLPIKVELGNLKKEPLLRNLEITVTNLATKPIYYLKLSVLLPEVQSTGGSPIGFPLRYGRTDLIDFDEPVRPDDVPLQPGESFVFKIPAENLEALEKLDARKGLGLGKLKKVYLLFHLLNFGDKTGFSRTDGAPIPNIPKGQVVR